MHFRPATHSLVRAFLVTLAVAVVAQQETPKPTKTTFSSSAGQIKQGDSVTLTGTVAAIAPSDGTPSGSIEFFDGPSSLGSVDLAAVDGRVEASLALTSLSVGPHPITVRYSGDARFGRSVSPPEFVLVVARQ